MRPRDVIKQIEALGWTQDRVHSGHHVFKHPTLRGTLVVPVSSGDMRSGLAKWILSQARRGVKGFR